ncbi:MAG TPA: phosphatase PAP2 family protein [Vicinamibacterales bacterium]|nr:phosphatase PAP2 family protein [Vicinamibacterales bacterium]
MKWALALVLASMFALPTGAAAQDGDAPPPPPGLFRKLMVTLGRDLKRLPSRENAVVLVNGAILAAAAYPFDDITTLGASSSPLLKRSFSGFGKALGREWVQGGGALAAYVAGHLWDKPQMIAAGGDLIEAQLVALTVTQGLKFAVGRTRPDGEARSFPSGHASAALATARVLHRHLGRRAAIPAYAIAVYTSVSRLQANSHYPSDVIAGAALGLAIAQTATIELDDARVQITPAVAPGSIAVVFTLR